jgi:hypothetical protein
VLQRDPYVYHVEAAERGWQLTRDGRLLPLWESRRRTEVLVYAQRMAANNRPSRLIVHLEDGGVEWEEFFESEEREPGPGDRRW